MPRRRRVGANHGSKKTGRCRSRLSRSASRVIQETIPRRGRVIGESDEHAGQSEHCDAEYADHDRLYDVRLPGSTPVGATSCYAACLVRLELYARMICIAFSSADSGSESCQRRRIRASGVS
jgi:hypothetical protein